MTDVKKWDAIVVGSGAGALFAALPQVEAGREVLMLDVGIWEDSPAAGGGNFSAARREDPNQHLYFLGPQYEGISFGGVAPGAQLTPPRQFVVRPAPEAVPVCAKGFHFLESFARGGLASAWGAACFPFNEKDLGNFEIPLNEWMPHYEAVQKNIGLCGDSDLGFFFPPLKNLSPAPKPDDNAAILFENYLHRRERFNAEGFFLGRPWMAMGKGEDEAALAARDLDFWDHEEGGVWRPIQTLRKLQQFPNFEYRPQMLVESFSEGDGGVWISARDLSAKRPQRFFAEKLLLGAGPFGTAKVVLRSLSAYGEKIPFLCQPCLYVPMVNSPMLGRVGRDERHSLTQLLMIFENGDETLTGQLYSYRSLLQHRLLGNIFLPIRQAARILRSLQPALMILNLHFEDRPHPEKYSRLLREGDRDVLEICHAPDREKTRARRQALKKILKNFRRLRCFGLKGLDPGFGASIHYAGTFPMTREEKPLTVDRYCRLRGSQNVFLVDGSFFPNLPAKGHTFMLMANAHRVGSLLCR